MMSLSRSAIRHTAWATLAAVLFVVLLPAAVGAVGRTAFQGFDGLGEICSVEGVKHAPNTPDTPDTPDTPVSGTAAHRPCVFCTSSVAIFADAHAPRVIAVIDGVPVHIGPHPAQELPPDPAATRPISPRAPPRSN